jgi:hypothetical protein
MFTNDYHDRRLLNVCPHKNLVTKKDLEDIARTYFIVEADGKPRIVSLLEKNGDCRPSSSEQLDLPESQCFLPTDRHPCHAGIVLVPIK